MTFDALYRPLEHADEHLAGLLEAAPVPVALALAVLLGLRHALDPDHLVAVTSIVAARGRDVAAGVRLGAWWGAGHAATLLAVGVPVVAFQGSLPGWLQAGAERLVGLVIVVLAVRVLWDWWRRDVRLSTHAHRSGRHRHLHVGASPSHPHRLRGPRQALAIGALHGLAGTGAIVLLLAASLPGRAEAALALAAFAPMSALSMAACTGAFGWALTRRRLAALRAVAVPALGVFGVLFGAWYMGG